MSDEVFLVTLRGYDRGQVDAVLRSVDEALATESPRARADARSALQSPDFTIVLRGYDMVEVDDAIKDRLRLLDGGDPAAPPETRRQVEFVVALRGYQPSAVDQLMARSDEAVASDSAVLRASVRDALTNATFPKVWRGYDVNQVNQEIKRRLNRLK